MLNNWIKFMIKCSKLYNQEPEIVENVVNKGLTQASDKYKENPISNKIKIGGYNDN